jgi:hypothetical protein
MRCGWALLLWLSNLSRTGPMDQLQRADITVVETEKLKSCLMTSAVPNLIDLKASCSPCFLGIYYL